MIELKNVSLIIKHEKIIDNVSYRFIDNKIYGLQGRNGSGKSMLLSIIAGLTKPTAGSVQADGAMLFKDRDFPESIGALINTPGMINSMSGYDNLKLLAELRMKSVMRKYPLIWSASALIQGHASMYDLTRLG